MGIVPPSSIEPTRPSNRLQRLTSSKRPGIAVCYGEVLIDHFDEGSFVGGAPLNVAARLRGLGWEVFLVSRVGDDAEGEMIVDTMARLALDTSFIQIDPELPTGAASVSPTDTEGRFAIEHPSAWDHIERIELPGHDLFYFGTLVARTQRGLAGLLRALEASTASVKICDVNLRPPWARPETLQAALGHATVIKCSQAELSAISALGVEGVFEAYPAVALLAVTSGEDGSTIYRPDSEVHLAAPDVAVVDTVGAGDAFTAGLIDGLAENLSDTGILERATAAAAVALQARGGLPTH